MIYSLRIMSLHQSSKACCERAFPMLSSLRPVSPAFDPISLLVEDAVSSEPPELFFDFLDCLLTQQQQQPPPLGKCGCRPLAHIPCTRLAAAWTSRATRAKTQTTEPPAQAAPHTRESTDAKMCRAKVHSAVTRWHPSAAGLQGEWDGSSTRDDCGPRS